MSAPGSPTCVYGPRVVCGTLAPSYPPNGSGGGDEGGGSENGGGDPNNGLVSRTIYGGTLGAVGPVSPAPYVPQGQQQGSPPPSPIIHVTCPSPQYGDNMAGMAHHQHVQHVFSPALATAFIPQGHMSPIIGHPYVGMPAAFQTAAAALAPLTAPPVYIGQTSAGQPLAAEAAHAAAQSAQAAGAITSTSVPECRPEQRSSSCLWPWIILALSGLILALLAGRYFSQRYKEHHFHHHVAPDRVTSVSTSTVPGNSVGTTVPWARWFDRDTAPQRAASIYLD